MQMQKPKMPKMGKDTMSVDTTMHPSIHFSSKNIPEIADWKVKGKYKIILDIVQTSKSERIIGNEKKVDGNFDIVGYKSMSGKDVMEMDEKEFDEYFDKSVAKGHLA